MLRAMVTVEPSMETNAPLASKEFGFSISTDVDALSDVELLGTSKVPSISIAAASTETTPPAAFTTPDPATVKSALLVASTAPPGAFTLPLTTMRPSAVMSSVPVLGVTLPLRMMSLSARSVSVVPEFQVTSASAVTVMSPWSPTCSPKPSVELG